MKLRQLASGDPPYRIARRGRSLVFYGKDGTYSLDLALSEPPRRVHKSWFFLPSTVDDRVWVALLDPTSPETVRALRAVVEVTSSGVVTVPPVRPPGGRWPVAAVTDGLLLEHKRGGLELWDPIRDTVIRRLPAAWPGPTHGNLLAWCDGSGPNWGASLHLTDVPSNSDRWRIDPPKGFAVFGCSQGAFAPDGRTLAIPVARSRLPAAPYTLALVDRASGHVTVVADSEVAAGYVFVAWSASGRQVFLTGGERFQSRTIVAYQLGQPTARTLSLNLPAFYGIAAS
jgi:hypothetical protein